MYRFCIGVLFEVTRGMSLKSRLAKLDKLVKLLPTTIEVASLASGKKHAVEDVAVEANTDRARPPRHIYRHLRRLRPTATDY